MIIAIDGIDGSGKRVQSSRLITYLKEKGKNVIFKRVPSRHLTGNSLADGSIFLKDLIRVRWLIALARKSLDESIIIIERYILSVAYAPCSKMLYRLLRNIFLSPDIYILLDVSPEVAFNRIKNRKRHQSHETIPELSRIRQLYLALTQYEKKKSKLYIVNAEKSKKEVEKCILNILES